jgi:hypothetical protein
MSSHKIRIAKLESLRESAGRLAGKWWSAVWFMEARARGMVLCRDGKERTMAAWLKTLDPITAAQISNLGITSREQGSENKE